MNDGNMSARLAALSSLAGAGMLVAGLFGSAPGGVSPVTARAATPAITFETPRVADPIHTYGEPDIGIAPNQPLYVAQPNDQTSGEVYVSGPTGTGTQRSIWQGSVDGGHTFRNITRSVPAVPIDPCGVLGTCTPLAAPGGGDTEIAFDHNRKQYFADLYALACQHNAARTVDAGHQEHVAEGVFPGGCPGAPGSDRQWFMVKDPNINYGPPPHPTGATTPLIYMETNTVAASCNGPASGGGGWYKSTNGLVFSSAITGQLGGALNTYCPFGADGYPSIDQVTGKVLQAEFGTVNGKDALQLNIGTPDQSNPGNLCFLDDSVTLSCRGEGVQKGLITIAVNDPNLNDVIHDNASEAANFTVSSMDNGRNLWVIWVNHATDPKLHQAWVSVGSSTCPNGPWTCWSTPVKVSQPPSSVAIFPWIQAGDAGRADAVWYGDSTLAAPNDTSVKHVWDVYMSQIVFPTATANVHNRPRTVTTTGVDVTATPHPVQVKVTPHPMDLEDVCLLGTACITALGNRNLADFFEIRTDNTGAAMIVYDDMSNGLCQALFGCPAAQVVDHAGAAVVTIARQASGESIYNDSQGNPIQVTGPSNAPVTGLADAPADALFPLFGGTNVPQMDVVDNRLATAGRTLTITTKYAGDPRDLAGATSATGCSLPTCQAQFVTRWQMGTGLYYGMFEVGPQGQQFYAGASQTIDDCSVSACDPHGLVYPDLAGATETGSVDCPPTPSAATPCTVTETINVADIGSPTNSSLLEEVGSYSFSSTLPQSALSQVTERLDNGATEIDGVCCYNFRPAGITAPPPGGSSNGGPTTTLPNTSTAVPAFGILLITLVAAPLALDAWARRRRRARQA